MTSPSGTNEINQKPYAPKILIQKKFEVFEIETIEWNPRTVAPNPSKEIPQRTRFTYKHPLAIKDHKKANKYGTVPLHQQDLF